jgi:hypothetical protein
MSMPHRCRGQDGVINCEGFAGDLEHWDNFDRLHRLLLV